MPEQLLDRIHAQIRGRVRELEPAVRESEELEAAIAALDGRGAGDPARLTPTSAASPTRAHRRRAKRAARGPGNRAPRGANRVAALRVLEERPGVGATELAQATGIARPVLHDLLRTLEERGEVAKEPRRRHHRLPPHHRQVAARLTSCRSAREPFAWALVTAAAARGS